MMDRDLPEREDDRLARLLLEGAIQLGEEEEEEPILPDWIEGIGFRAIAYVGRGGSGVVWKACNRQTGGLVALKLITFAGDLEEAHLRWLREAGLATKIESPNLLKVNAYGLSPDHRAGWLAMEWIEGASLDRILAREKQVPWEKVRDWAKQACSGLTLLHEAGLTHRDIKPGNLLLEEETGRLVISDFGLLSPIGERWLTRTLVVHATPGYASPECWRGEGDPGPKSDQYSLAATLWHLLAGYPPQGSFGALAGVPAQVEDALRKALSPDPSARYASVDAFWKALNRFALPGSRQLRRWLYLPLLLLPLIVSLVVLMLADRNQQEASIEYPQRFESPQLQIVDNREAYVTMEATLHEDGLARVKLVIDNRELVHGITTIAEITLLDKDGIVLHREVGNPLGVNGRLIPGSPPHRTEFINFRIEPSLLPRVSTMGFAVHSGAYRKANRHDVFKQALKKDLRRLKERAGRSVGGKK